MRRSPASVAPFHAQIGGREGVLVAHELWAEQLLHLKEDALLRCGEIVAGVVEQGQSGTSIERLSALPLY